jgi:hypothetical protein
MGAKKFLRAIFSFLCGVFVLSICKTFKQNCTRKCLETGQ